MPTDSIVRVSFESEPRANQAANNALVGHAQNATGSGPFERVATAVYTCSNAADASVGASIAQLGQALQQWAHVLDFVSISMVRRR